MKIFIDDGEFVKIYAVKNKVAKAVMTLLEAEDDEVIYSTTDKGYEVAILDKNRKAGKTMEQRLIDKKDFIEKHRRWLYIAVDNYIPSILGIPENPTNGELIEAMFPDGKIWKSGNYMCLLTNGQGDAQMLDLDWWNTPYKKGAKEC